MSEMIYEGKTPEEAIMKAERELGVERDSLEIEVLEDKGKGLLGLPLGRKVRVMVSVKREDIVSASTVAGETLDRLLELSGLRGKIEVRENPDEIVLDVSMEDDGDESLFIGRRGKNIDSYQYLVNKIVTKRVPHSAKRIVLDCAGYRAKRTDRIEKMARKAARKVKSEGSAYTFPPMEAVERRIIHLTMKREGLLTESKGQGRDRKVVVYPPGHTEAA